MRVGLPPSFLPCPIHVSESEPVPVLGRQNGIVRGVGAPQVDAPVAGVTPTADARPPGGSIWASRGTFRPDGGFPVLAALRDLREDRVADRDDAGVTLENISAPGEEGNACLQPGNILACFKLLQELVVRLP